MHHAVLGQLQNIPTGPASGHNRNLLHRVRMGQEETNHGMTCLMVSHCFFIFLAHHPAFLFRPHGHSVKSILEFKSANGALFSTGRKDSGFI
jgi:hypothetical protein